VQVGDDVVLIKDLYNAFLAMSSNGNRLHDGAAAPPDRATSAAQPSPSPAHPTARTTLATLATLRPCEPCRVQAIDYVMAPTEPRHTIARVTLSADGAEHPFHVDVPPPLDDYSEFLVPRRRFDEAAAAEFRVGDSVRVFMLDGDSGQAVGYAGTVVSDKLGGQVPVHTFACAHMLNRYKVRAKLILLVLTESLCNV
jgi:hypothetical protein